MFLIDKETDELVAKVFDGIQANDNENEVWHVFRHDKKHYEKCAHPIYIDVFQV